jgi:hypothetical protein
MKALSMTQPWASLLATGRKQIETRSWRTKYRGPIAIHAATKFPPNCTGLFWREPFRIQLSIAGIREFHQLKTGAIIGVCEIVDCIPTEEIREGLCYPEINFGDYSDGRWAWLCRNAVSLHDRPITCKGALSLWETPAWTNILLPDPAAV